MPTSKQTVKCNICKKDIEQDKGVVVQGNVMEATGCGGLIGQNFPTDNEFRGNKIKSLFSVDEIRKSYYCNKCFMDITVNILDKIRMEELRSKHEISNTAYITDYGIIISDNLYNDDEIESFMDLFSIRWQIKTCDLRYNSANKNPVVKVIDLKTAVLDKFGTFADSREFRSLLFTQKNISKSLVRDFLRNSINDPADYYKLVEEIYGMDMF